MLGAAPGVGPFSSLAARAYSSLDVALDLQAIVSVENRLIWDPRCVCENRRGEWGEGNRWELLYNMGFPPSIIYINYV